MCSGAGLALLDATLLNCMSPFRGTMIGVHFQQTYFQAYLKKIICHFAGVLIYHKIYVGLNRIYLDPWIYVGKSI